jgi:hypothetical protein
LQPGMKTLISTSNGFYTNSLKHSDFNHGYYGWARSNRFVAVIIREIRGQMADTAVRPPRIYRAAFTHAATGAGSGRRSRVADEMQTCSVRTTAARLSTAPVFQIT